MMAHSDTPSETQNAGSSWFVKIVLGLIIIAFAFWGISGYFQGQGSVAAVAEVGDVKVSKDYFRHRMNQLVSQMKGAIPLATLQELGFTDRLLENIIHKILLDLEIQELRLTTGEQTILRYLHMDPTFRNDEGKFDPKKLGHFLKNVNMSEKQLLQDMHSNILQQQLLTAIAGGVVLPISMALPLYEHIMETRDFDLTLIPHNDMKISKKPTEEDLQAFYDSHQEMFQHPEFRRFTVLEVTPDMLTKSVSFTTEELKKNYKENINLFTTPEERQVLVLSLKPGEEFTPKKAKQFSARFVDLGALKKEMVDPEVADTVFSLKKNSYSDVITTGKNRKVFWVKKIHKAKVQSFNKAKAAVLAHQKAAYAQKEISTLTQQIDDQVAGGDTLEAIAKEHDIALYQTHALSAAGETLKGDKKLEEITVDMIQTAFQHEENIDTPFASTPDGKSYMVRVDEIMPAAVSPLAEITSEVKAAWLQDQQKAAAEKIAQKISAAVNAGQKARGGKYASKRLPNAQSQQLLKAEHIPLPETERAFEIKEGQSVVAHAGTNAVVITAGKLNSKTAQSTPKEYGKYKEMMNREYGKDIEAAFMQALHDKFGVEIHEDVVKSLGE